MIVVVGLGITGLSVVHYLKKNHIAANIAVMDTRIAPPDAHVIQTQYPEIPCYFGGLDETILLQATEIILSPGVALAEPAIQAALKRGISVIGDIELFARFVKAPVVAITGTNGKSTVTTMIGDLAQAAGVKVAVGGNLGQPALNLLQEEIELYVLELSSFQLETTYTLAPTVAILLNITEDHSDRYHSADDYRMAKHRIFEHAQLAVYNRADSLTKPHNLQLTQQSFGLDAPQNSDLGVKTINHEAMLMCGDNTLFPVATLASQRPNFINNALAALSVVGYFGWNLNDAQTVLHDFKSLPHRCQLVLEKNGVRWYNDSKATNVGATIAALQDVGAEIKGKQIILLGGVGKGADFSDLKTPIHHYAKHAILFGEASHEIAAILPNDFPYTMVASLQEAISVSEKLALPGDAVVLAPACASFDMFKDYKDRGEQFMALVNVLR
jgi:UDP-N-acetylmuramoylalanine--D-glutamate ligase